MKTYHIAALPGDGVGPEIIEAATKVLKMAEKINGGFELDFQSYSVGCTRYLIDKQVISDDVYRACGDADAIFMGSMGMNKPGEMILNEKGTEVNGADGMFKLRFGFQLYAGVRPIKTYHGVPGALCKHDNIDFVILRESTEGLFASVGGGVCLNDELAVDTQIITRRGSERVHKYAFETAAARNGRPKDGKRLVTCAHKGNNLVSFSFFKKIFEETARGYADKIQSEDTMIDALTLLMTQFPENYDVIVAENSHGDIISDLAAAYIGGLGMAPSGDIGDDTAMFQPAHGTAPSIAGKNIVNPTATILSGRMMLEWLGNKHADPALAQAAAMIENAVENTFRAGLKTQDVGGKSSTGEFADEVIRQLKKIKV